VTDSRPRRERSDAVARREQYAGLRREGMTPWDAADATGTHPKGVTARRYEAWFQAGVRGDVILRPGGAA
jgi:hypothetical protein